MGEVEDLTAHRTAARSGAIAAEIEGILQKLGGSAHRTVIVSQVGARRGLRNNADLDREVDGVLRAHEATGDGGRPGPLFARAFGPQSHRWTLRPAPSAEVFTRVVEG